MRVEFRIKPVCADWNGEATKNKITLKILHVLNTNKHRMPSQRYAGLQGLCGEQGLKTGAVGTL